MKFIKIIAFLIIVGTITVSSIKSSAYTVSYRLDIDPDSVEPGHIISYDGTTYSLSDIPYDPRIYGVVTENTDVAIFEKGEDAHVHVANIGEVYIKVSGINGDIKSGDLITSSKIPGVGMKAKGSGNILGTALEDISFENKKDQGTILLSIGIKDIEQHSKIASFISRILNRANSDSVSDPFNLLRYFISAVIVSVAFTFGLKSIYTALLNNSANLSNNPDKSETAIYRLGKICLLKSVIFISLGLFFAFIILVI